MNAAAANLVVSLTFNPPEVFIVGPVKDTTIHKLERILPDTCTSSPGEQAAARFARVEQPPHWYCRLPAAFCDDVGQANLMLAVLDCLEQEGGWKMKGSNAFNHDEVLVSYKLFFARKL
eukprot:EG_transcript_29149